MNEIPATKDPQLDNGPVENALESASSSQPPRSGIHRFGRRAATANPVVTGGPGEPHRLPRKPLVAALAVLVLAAGGLAWHFHARNTGALQIPLPQPQAAVSITSAGLTPATLSIPPGTTVTWINQTGTPQAIGAAPYPSHASLPQLVSQPMQPGQSYAFTFTQPGTWSYQDDSNPLIHGVIVVK